MAAPAMNKESMSRGMLSLTDDCPPMSIWLNAPPTTMYSANTCEKPGAKCVLLHSPQQVCWLHARPDGLLTEGLCQGRLDVECCNTRYFGGGKATFVKGWQIVCCCVSHTIIFTVPPEKSHWHTRRQAIFPLRMLRCESQ